MKLQPSEMRAVRAHVRLFKRAYNENGRGFAQVIVSMSTLMAQHRRRVLNAYLKRIDVEAGPGAARP